jgi:hypothetical protein
MCVVAGVRTGHADCRAFALGGRAEQTEVGRAELDAAVRLPASGAFRDALREVG